MTDVFSKEKRSEVMSHIRGKGNKDTELTLVKILRHNKITGWRRNYPLLGKPDFVFPKQHFVIFVDGCFWHRCPWHSTIPENNHEFWKTKLKKNQERDVYISTELEKKGWKVLRIWEHDLKDQSTVVKEILLKLDPKKI